MKTFLSALLVFSSCVVHGQDSCRDILLTMFKTVKSHESVSYKASVSFKFFSKADTMKFAGNVFLQRVKNDTVFGGKIRYSTDDTFYKFYDTKRIYEVNKNQRKVKTYDPHNGEEWGMSGNVRFDIVWQQFLQPGKIKDYFSKGNKLTLLPDTVLNRKKCYQIQVDYPDDSVYTEHKAFLCITKAGMVPISTVTVIKFQGEYQYGRYMIEDCVFDKVDPSLFSIKQVPPGYSTEVYKKKEEDYHTLDTGMTAPVIFGQEYGSSFGVDTVGYSGKITVLDFWYMACMPCIRSIPKIERITQRYSTEQVQIFGINSMNNNAADMSKMPTFLKHNPMKYPILFVDEHTPDMFKVKAWPTFYVIDKHGKIAYSAIGFSETLFEDLDAVISGLLKAK